MKPHGVVSSSSTLLPGSRGHGAVINCRVAPCGVEQQQRAVGSSGDLPRAHGGAVLHVGGVCGPEGQQQLRAASCRCPVPAEGGGGVGGGGVGGGVQQGAPQGGVLPDPHPHGGGWQRGGGVRLPPET